MSGGPLPLAGVKVVELARILAGPWAGQTLADLGAEVIKVESPQGDDTRKWGPPFVENEEGQVGNLPDSTIHPQPLLMMISRYIFQHLGISRLREISIMDLLIHKVMNAF